MAGRTGQQPRNLELDNPGRVAIGHGSWPTIERSFSYLVNSIDTAALLPAALDQNLVTSRQRSECDNEVNQKKKAETFVGYIEEAVNGNSDNFQSFILILEESGQTHIASRLRG